MTPSASPTLAAPWRYALLCAGIDSGDCIRLLGHCWRSDEMYRYLHVPAQLVAVTDLSAAMLHRGPPSAGSHLLSPHPGLRLQTLLLPCWPPGSSRWQTRYYHPWEWRVRYLLIVARMSQPPPCSLALPQHDRQLADERNLEHPLPRRETLLIPPIISIVTI